MKLSKALGPLGAALEGGTEFAIAKTEGDSTGTAAARGLVEVGTSTAAWPLRQFSLGAAGINQTLYNPQTWGDVVPALRGDEAAKARWDDRARNVDSQRAAVNSFYDNLSKNIVDAATPTGGQASPQGTAQAMSPGGLAAGLGGIALGVGAFALSRGKKPVAPQNISKAAKAAQAAYQSAKATQAGAKAAQAGAKAKTTAANVAAKPAVQKFLTDAHSQFTAKVNTPGKLAGVVATGALVSPLIGLASKPVSAALRIPGAAPAAPGAPPAVRGGMGMAGPVYGYGTQANAMYGAASEPAWWDRAFFGGRVNETFGHDAGLAWQQKESQEKVALRGQDLTLEGIQSTNASRLQQAQIAADGRVAGYEALAQGRVNAERTKGSYNAQVQDLKNQGMMQQTGLEGQFMLQGQQMQNQGNLQVQQSKNQGQLDNTNAQGGWNVTQEQIKQQGAMGVADITAQGRIQEADITGSWKNTAADTTGRWQNQTAATKGQFDLAGTKVKAGADMYASDNTLKGVGIRANADMYASDNTLKGKRYEVDGSIAQTQIKGQFDLQGEQVKAASANYQASEQRKASNYSAKAGMMGQIGAAAAGAKIGLSDAIPEMMKRGYNPMAGGMENISRMGDYARREERQAQLNEARDNTSFWARRDAQNQAKYAANNAAQDELRLQREKNRGDRQAEAVKGHNAWMIKTLFGG